MNEMINKGQFYLLLGLSFSPGGFMEIFPLQGGWAVHRNLFLWGIIILAAVGCSAGLLYREQQAAIHKQAWIAEDKTAADKGIDAAFPLPEKTSYEMKLYFDPIRRIIYGSSLIKTINNQSQALSELWLTTYPNVFKHQEQSPAPSEAYSGQFDPGWLTIKDARINQEPALIQEGGITCRLVPAAAIASGDPLTIEMTWEVKIPRVKYRFGYHQGVFMLGHFYPVLNVLDNKGWHNSDNSSFGDPFCLSSAAYLVSIDLPQEYKIISSGQIIKKVAEDNGRELNLIQAEKVRDLGLVIAGSGYQSFSRQYNQTLVNIHLPAQYRDSARDLAEKSADILKYYSCIFGSYPYGVLNVAFVPMLGFQGMEYSGLVLLREDILDGDFNKRRQSFLLAHEIAHQWWYALVGNDQQQEPWLDEGLANWSAYRYQQEREGLVLSPTASFGIIDLHQGIQQFKSQQDYYHIIYNGGGAFWLALEDELGQETVLKILRRYVSLYRFQIADTDDLLKLIKLETNRDMKEYFARWFSGSS